MSFATRLRGVTLTNAGLLWDESTGYEIGLDGQIIKTGIMFSEPTGYRIDDEGEILKIGVVMDSPTGFRIDESGAIIEIGVLWDNKTDRSITTDGALYKDGLMGPNRMDWPIPSNESPTSDYDEDRLEQELTKQVGISESGGVNFSPTPKGQNVVRSLFKPSFDPHFDIEIFRSILSRYSIIDRADLLHVMAHLSKSNGILPYYSATLNADELKLVQAAVINRYQQWREEISAMYLYGEIVGNNNGLSVFFLPAIIISFLALVPKTGGLLAITKALLLSLFITFMGTRLLALSDRCFSKTQLKQERNLVRIGLNVNMNRAKELVPLPIEWMWRFKGPPKPEHFDAESVSKFAD